MWDCFIGDTDKCPVCSNKIISCSRCYSFLKSGQQIYCGVSSGKLKHYCFDCMEDTYESLGSEKDAGKNILTAPLDKDRKEKTIISSNTKFHAALKRLCKKYNKLFRAIGSE